LPDVVAACSSRRSAPPADRAGVPWAVLHVRRAQLWAATCRPEPCSTRLMDELWAAVRAETAAVPAGRFAL